MESWVSVDVLSAEPIRVDAYKETVTSQDQAEHVSAFEDWDPAEERKLVRKLDLRVLLPCCITYFFAYLDRVSTCSSAGFTQY